MAGLTRDLVQRLLKLPESQRVLSFILALEVWSCRIYETFRGHYMAKFGHSIIAERSLQEAKKMHQSPAGAERRWDWHGLPHLPMAFVHIGRFTTCFFLFVLLRNLASRYFYAIINWFRPPLAAHCYLVGHFIAHESMDHQMATLFAAYHILWRLLMRLRDGDYANDLFVFLSMSDHDLDRFLAFVESPAGTSASSVTDSSVERLFSSAICYRRQVVHNNSVSFALRIRPNRTAQARRKLHRHVFQIWLLGTVSLLIVSLCVQTVVCYQIVDLRNYLRRYPGCNSQITSKMPGEWTLLPLTGHSLVATLLDLVGNIILWTETGYSVIAVWTCAYFLNYDIEVYCNKLSSNLEQLHKRVMLNRLPAITQHKIEAALPTELSAYDWFWRNQVQQLEAETHDLLAQFNDFFKHIQDTDLLVSDVLTFSIFIWVSLFAVLGHLSMKELNQSNDPAALGLILFVESFTYIVISIGCFNLLKLHSKCQGHYKIICSIMAHARGNQKEHFTRLLDFFTTKRSAYTIFQQYPFTKTTYLSIIGWSFSFLFILEGLRRK